MLKGIALSVLLAAPALAQDSNMLGRWTGEGFQDGDSWEMTVDMVQGAGRVDYPEFPCGGVWVMHPAKEGPGGVERLTYGHDICLDALEIRLSVTSAGKLRVVWFDDIGAEIAEANLTREGAQQSSGKKSN